jgi:hypothetical protein
VTQDKTRRRISGRTIRFDIEVHPTVDRLLEDFIDEYLHQIMEEKAAERDDLSFGEVMDYINSRRAADPDFLEPAKPGVSRLLISSSGASYDIAKLTAELSGSYLITDLYGRWKEIELDRASHSAESKAWAPFAKAVQSAPFKYFGQVRLEDALKLRQEGRLEELRAFFHRVWRQAVKGDEYGEANAVALADELHDKLREAEAEWDKIDRDLVKMVVAGGTASALAAGPLIASGHAAYVAAAVAVAGGGPVLASTMERGSFAHRFPAAFFMDLSKRQQNDS